MDLSALEDCVWMTSSLALRASGERSVGGGGLYSAAPRAERMARRAEGGGGGAQTGGGGGREKRSGGGVCESVCRRERGVSVLRGGRMRALTHHTTAVKVA